MRKWWLASVALLLIAWLALFSAGPAWAHAKLVESEPSGGDVLAEAPERVRLVFDEPVRFEEGGGAEPSPLDPIKVYSEEGTRVDKTDTRASPDDPEVLLVDLKKLSDGVYGVDWGVTSKDGHVIDGALGFTVDGADTKREGPVEPAAKNAPIGLGVVEIAALLGVLVLVVLALRWLVSRFSGR